MEYYGKILCISYNDLTYDDRPVMVNGKADYSRSRRAETAVAAALSCWQMISGDWSDK